MLSVTKINECQLIQKPKRLRVAAYCRVSTDSEEQQTSLDTQRLHYENYIKANAEWEFAGVYYDEGVTGTKKDIRKGLMTLISDCKKGKIDLILTKSISRFCRNLTDCLELVRQLLEINVSIFFEKENINTGTMESEFMLSIFSCLAENESVSIAQNERWGVQNRFKNGTYIVSTPPYGYTTVDKEMVIAPEQAEIVRRIFSECLNGKGAGIIAKELNEQGISARKGGKWTSTSVISIIRNEKYTGDALFQKTYTDSSFKRHANKGECNQYLCAEHHEAIVSRDVYDKANALVDRRGKEKGNGTDTQRYMNRYEFSGKIKCGECGGTFKRRTTKEPNGEYISWCCNRHIEDKTACSMKFIKDDAIKAAFTTMMNKLIFSHQVLLKPLLKSAERFDQERIAEELQAVESQIEKLKERKQTLTNLAANGILEPQLYQKEHTALVAEYDKLQSKKNVLVSEANVDNEKLEALKSLVRFVQSSEMLTAYDKVLFENVVKQITVISRKEIEFELFCGLKLKEGLN